MRKSLGNKRNEIGDGTNGKADQIAEITRIFGDFEEGPHSKVFDNEDFGYWRITVERPLRLNFVVDDERLERLKESKPFQGLATSRKKGAAGQKEIQAGQELQQQLLTALETLRGQPVSKNREDFTKLLKKSFKTADLSVPAPLLKAILSALGDPFAALADREIREGSIGHGMFHRVMKARVENASTHPGYVCRSRAAHNRVVETLNFWQRVMELETFL
jgi:type I restriction enzyme M protein